MLKRIINWLLNIDLIELQTFFMVLKIEEMLCPNYNVQCNFRGHKFDKKTAFQELHLMDWSELPDGFKYKEIDSFCERCKSNLSLFLYPHWPSRVIPLKRCQ